MSWFSEVEAEGRLISREWKAWRPAAESEITQTTFCLIERTRACTSRER
jgi:hypothetical protein